MNSVKCITLGHNYNFDNLEHPYFGSNKIIEDLKTFESFEANGFVELNGDNIRHDPLTKLVNKII